jgi:hypothetical protein
MPLSPTERLLTLAQSAGVDVDSEAFAQLLDAQDKLAPLRDEFVIPKTNDGRGRLCIGEFTSILLT